MSILHTILYKQDTENRFLYKISYIKVVLSFHSRFAACRRTCWPLCSWKYDLDPECDLGVKYHHGNPDNEHNTAWLQYYWFIVMHHVVFFSFIQIELSQNVFAVLDVVFIRNKADQRPSF